MLQKVDREIQRVDNAFELISALPDDDSVRSHWAKYLCVLTSGLVENCISEIFGEFARVGSNNEVFSHVYGRLEKLQNMHKDKIEALARSFSQDWGDEIRNLFESDQEIKDALGSVLGNRHQIAHGGTLGLTYSRMSYWYAEIKRLITFLHELVFPTTTR